MEEVVSKVLDEIGINLTEQLADAPTKVKAPAAKAPARAAVAEGDVPPAKAGGGGADGDVDADLLARLDALKKS